MLWEGDVNMLTEYKSYQLNRIKVHHYCGNYEVTFPKFGASYEEIEDLEYVDTLVSRNDQPEDQRCTIVGVNLETIFMCISCKHSIPDLHTGPNPIHMCESCDTTQKLRNPRTSARLYIEDENGKILPLRAYSDTLSQLARSATITTDNLLDKPPFGLSYNKYCVITSITEL